MVSIRQLQQKSCSSLQQRNQNVGNQANNISQKAMTAPSFTGDHLSAQSSMGRAQVSMNGSKMPFKGCRINRQIEQAIKSEIKNPTEIGAEGKVQEIIVETVKNIFPHWSEKGIETARRWEGHPPHKPNNMYDRLCKIRERQLANGSAAQYEEDHLKRFNYYKMMDRLDRENKVEEAYFRLHPDLRRADSGSGSGSAWDGYIDPCCYGL